MAKRRLDQQRHPIDEYPFEAFYGGSWWNVECVVIKDGTIITCFEHRGHQIEESILVSNLRIRSRRALPADCTCFLRPNINISVFSSYPSEINSCEKSLQPAWLDAKISSIKRKPHHSQCTCQFYVSFGGVHHSVGSAHQETEEVKLDNIAILQQLERKPSGDESRWRYSNDCPSRYEAKLRGQFLYDISWLLVASSLKGLKFELRSMQGKMVYRVVDGDQQMFCFGYDEIVKTINFTSDENGVMRPNIRTFEPKVSKKATVKASNIETGSYIDLEENEVPSPSSCNIFYLRRSKRRNVQPNRFVGDCTFRAETGKRKRTKEVDKSAINLVEADNDCLNHILKHQIGAENSVHVNKDHAEWKIIAVPRESRQLEHQSKVEVLVDASEIHANERNSCSEVKTARKALGTEPKKKKKVKFSSKPHVLEHEFGVKKLADASDIHANKRNSCSEMNTIGEGIRTEQKKKKVKFSPMPASINESDSAKSLSMRKCLHCGIRKTKHWRSSPSGSTTLCNSCGVRYTNGRLFPKYRPASSPTFVQTMHSNFHKKVLEMNTETQLQDMRSRTKFGGVNKTPKAKNRKKSKITSTHERLVDGKNNSSKTNAISTSLSNTTDIVLYQKDAANSKENFGTSPKCVKKSSTTRRRASSKKGLPGIWKGSKKMGSKEKLPSKALRRSLLFSRRKLYSEQRTYRRNTLTGSEYKEVIEICMKNIEAEIQKPQPTVLSQWESVVCNQKRFLSSIPTTNNQEKKSELDDLWKDMDATLNSFHFIKNAQSDFEELSNEADGRRSCHHDFILDEEIGMICRFCKYVSTEIRHVLPPFLQRSGRISDRHMYDQKMYSGDLEFDIVVNSATSRDISREEHKSVWSLIPDLQSELHPHQKKGFEFIWRNLAGSLVPANMHTLERNRGCVISHSPGSGKTFLIITFLTSYFKLFPSIRPIILAPRSILYTWDTEFKKWGVPIPVYHIHGRRNYKMALHHQTAKDSPGDFKPNQDVQHAVDCLEKLGKWHEGPSVLLIGYQTFLSLMRENSKLEHWNYMARVLKTSTGLLILDEGHNPRSTRSRLRKLLMKVKTDQRILLSGTLFQNNFEEYFNTLCLARPCFITEMLQKLASKEFIKQQRLRKTIIKCSKEKQARKVFMDNIAERIKSKVEQERRIGLHMLKNLTDDFIDVYDGGNSDALPGLQTYRLLLKTTETQKALLAKLQKGDEDKRHYMELELLVTFVSIHPCLVSTLRYAEKVYSYDEREEIKKCRLDVKQGPKVWFVVNLIRRCIIKREKVLIFCHNIAPITLFVEIFEKLFGWSKGEEVLVFQGDLDEFERGNLMEKFEDPNGSSHVLLASIGACGEGISLTAASRVVFLDSEWNPSKTKQAVARAFRPGQERVVYVYQLLASGTMEEDKYGKNTWKEHVSRMIFVGEGMEDSSCRPADDIDDEVLKEIVEEDQGKTFHIIMKDEKLTTHSVRDKEGALYSFK